MTSAAQEDARQFRPGTSQVPETADHGLSRKQLATVSQILAPWADRITAVEVFGSRATGAYRPNSDLDLLLHGTLEQRTIDRLWTLFHESNLPFAVDVKSYDLITYEPLRNHMDRVRRPLFDSLSDRLPLVQSENSQQR